MDEQLECLDCHKSDDTVKWTTTPDRSDFKAFPRCPDCHENRLKSALRTMNRYPEAFGPGSYSEEVW